MKIHAGLYRGHKISRVNKETTRETSAMVREAVFNMLGPIAGNVLDLFSGSGSYGLSALSLGAEHVVLVDKNITAYQVLLANVKKLKCNDSVDVIKNDYQVFLAKNKIKYDYIFLDPPFDFANYEKLIMLTSNYLTENGKIIVEYSSKLVIKANIETLKLLKTKQYGTKKVNIFIKQF